MCVCVCVCVCVRARCVCVRPYVYECMNVKNDKSVLIATCTTQFTHLYSKCDEISKVYELKILRICHLYTLRKLLLA